MTQAMKSRVCCCRPIHRVAYAVQLRRKLGSRATPPQRRNGAEKEPIEKSPLTPYNARRNFRDSEAWNQFFASLQKLEGDFNIDESQDDAWIRAAEVVDQETPPATADISPFECHALENPYVDAETIAASLVMEQVYKGQISLKDVSTALGPSVSKLTRATLEIRALIDDVDVLEDVTARKIQEVVFERCDNRAILLQFISASDAVFHSQFIPRDMQVPLAYDCLYVYIGFGRLLGMDELAARMEEYCMEVLFPASHAEIAAHLHQATSSSADVFLSIRKSLERGMEERRELKELVDKVEIKTRVKSTSSFLRKELSLTELAKGGRKKDEIYDTLGVRVIAWPRREAEVQSEEMAVEGCYVISDIAHRLWPVIPSRSKDYIQHPKANGYRSLHSTHRSMPPGGQLSRGDSAAQGLKSYPTLDAFYDNTIVINDPAQNDGDLVRQNVVPTGNGLAFELQIRTKKMDEEAEHGRASHAFYKSGLGHKPAS